VAWALTAQEQGCSNFDTIAMISTIPSEYRSAFDKAKMTYQCQPVFNPRTAKLQPLSPWAAPKPSDVEFAGQFFSDSLAITVVRCFPPR
jgi:hypothetical protein